MLTRATSGLRQLSEGRGGGGEGEGGEGRGRGRGGKEREGGGGKGRGGEGIGSSRAGAVWGAVAAAGASSPPRPLRWGGGPGEDVHSPALEDAGWGEGPHRAGVMGRGAPRRCAFLASCSSRWRRRGPWRPGARRRSDKGRAGHARTVAGAAGVCDTLPPTWHTWGPGDAGGGGASSFLWSLSLPGFLLLRCADCLFLLEASGHSARCFQLLLP